MDEIPFVLVFPVYVPTFNSIIGFDKSGQFLLAFDIWKTVYLWKLSHYQQSPPRLAAARLHFTGVSECK